LQGTLRRKGKTPRTESAKDQEQARRPRGKKSRFKIKIVARYIKSLNVKRSNTGPLERTNIPREPKRPFFRKEGGSIRRARPQKTLLRKERVVVRAGSMR